MLEICVIGLGPGDPANLTLQAAEKLLGGQALVLRTGRHGVAAWLDAQDVDYTTLDSLYEEAQDFDDLDARVAGRLLEMAEEAQRHGVAPLLYGVPGHGLLEDTTVAALRHGACSLTVIPGLPAPLAEAAQAAGMPELPDLSGGLVLLPANHTEGLRARPRLPVLVTQLDDPIQAGEAKLALAEHWGDEAQGILLSGETPHLTSVYQLDWEERLDHDSCLLLMDRGEDARYDMTDLLEIMERLRRFDGCPWDREQTHASLARYMIEEAYEVADAIAAEDEESLCAELGDVLLQVVFHSLIAREHGAFTLRDVTDAVCRKMVRRHPHIFGGAAEPVSWEELKQAERGQETVSDAMRGLAASLPGLTLAEKVQEKAARVGFDWKEAAGALDKVLEEAAEVAEELGQPEEVPGRLEKEIGDLLFSVVNVARLCAKDPEAVLRGAVDKFIERFSYVENRALAAGHSLADTPMEELDAYWEEAKRQGL